MLTLQTDTVAEDRGWSNCLQLQLLEGLVIASRTISYTRKANAFAGMLLLKAGEKPLKKAAAPSAAYSCDTQGFRSSQDLQTAHHLPECAVQNIKHG